MTTKDLFDFVIDELNSRNLKDKSRRLNALKQIKDFVKERYNDDVSCFRQNKNDFKDEYEKYKGKSLSGAESSAINELYNQFMLHDNEK